MIINILLLFITIQNFAQSENISLNLHRVNALSSKCEVQVFVNDQLITNINNTEKIQLKFKNEQTIKLTILGDNPKFMYDYTLELKKGEVYNYNVKPRIPTAKGFKLIVLDTSLYHYKYQEKSYSLE